MNCSETVGFKVRAYEILGEQHAAGVAQKDTLRTIRVEARLQQDEKLAVNVSDFDPEGSTFLGSHGWEKLGFFMSITSVGQEFTREAMDKGYDPEEVLRDIAPELGRFSVLTVAQPIYSLAPSMKNKLERNPGVREYFESKRIPQLIVPFNSQGPSRVYGEIRENIEDNRFTFHKPEHYSDRLQDWYTQLSEEDTFSPSDYENLREVHDLLEQQAIDHVVEAAKLPAAA